MPGFVNKYKIIQKIGEGSFSEVLKCEDRTTKELFAAKILKKNFQNTSDVYFCAEIIAMQKLGRHPNVLYMHEYFFEKSSGKLIFIFELMDMSMYEFMKSKRRCIPEMKVKNYLYQMLKGLDYLHRHGLFHRDIKPENILVRLQSNQSVIPQQSGELVKLADLGSIRGIYSKPPYTEYISTRWYRSPECLLTIGHYGPKMDIWATGCVFYEILTMKPLFPGTNEIDQLSKIHTVLGTPSTRLLSKLKSRSRNLQNFTKQIGTGLNPLINNFSDDAQTILKLMLQYDPDIRSNARRLLQHKYFAMFREDERFKKFNKQYVAREFGDTPTDLSYTQTEKLKCAKFQSNSMRSVYNNEKSKPAPLFSSRTTVELLNRKTGSLGSYPAKSNVKMYNTNSETLKFKPRQQQKNTKQTQNGKSIFRNTTSNVLKHVSDLGGSSEEKLRSSSFVISKRSNQKERKLPDAKRHKI